MKVIDDVREFLTRERRWRWILLALVFIVVGQIIERAKIDWMGLPERGKVFSFTLYDRLRVIQLDTVAQRYDAASRGTPRHRQMRPDRASGCTAADVQARDGRDRRACPTAVAASAQPVLVEARPAGVDGRANGGRTDTGAKREPDDQPGCAACAQKAWARRLCRRRP